MDSQKQRSLKLARQIEAQEQKLASLKVSTKTAQDQWDDRRTQIASDTEVTIQSSREAIEAATVEAKKTLAKLKRKCDQFRTDCAAEMRGFESVKEAHLEEIDNLDRDKKVLSRTNATLQEENRTLSSEIEVRKETIEALKADEAKVTDSLSEIRTQDEAAADHLVELRKQEQTFTNDIEILTTDYDTKKAEYDKDISILELKKSDLQQEIIENQAKDEAVRDNLAKWSKTLDERDKNLRIRENKVNEQQKSIARNYNLLNL